MSEPVRDWLVKECHHQLWWGPDRGGYTANLLRAGLYTEAEAKAIEASSRRTQGDRNDQAIPLASMRAFIDEAAAGVARLRAALEPRS